MSFVAPEADAVALLAGAAVWIAWWGIGRPIGLGAGLGAGSARLDGGTCANLGLAVFLALCGPLELFEAARGWLFIGFVGVGLVAAALSGARRPRWGWRWPGGWAAAGLLVVLAAAAAYVVDVSWWRFGNVDDLQGYLVMPERILQTGSTGLDPFLFRRVEAGLGGSNYLYALFLALVDFTHLRIVDLALGGVSLLVTVASHARRSARGTALMVPAMMVALVVVVFAPIVNLSPDVLAIAILYSAALMASDMAEAADLAVASHLRLGLLVFALVVLRSTFMAPALAVLLALYGSLLRGGARLKILRPGLAICGLLLVLAAPWMAAVYRIAGTPLYPFLGFGTLTHDEVAAVAAPRVLVRSLVLVGACYALAVGSLIGLGRGGNGRPETERFGARLYFGLLAGVLLVLTGVSQVKYTVFAYRYSYVGLTAVPLLLFVESLVAERVAKMPAVSGWGLRQLAPRAGLALFLAVVMRNAPEVLRSGLFGAADRPAGGASGVLPQIDVSDPAQYAALSAGLRAMQDAVPPGRLILVRLDAPFLLDFRRNPIWVMDHPGDIGPPPGVPAGGDVAAWQSYLQQVGVPFVAYSYGNEAGYPVALGAWFQGTLAAPSFWQQRIDENTAAVQAMLLTLRRLAPALYDDGQRYVIALTPPLPADTRTASLPSAF